jgi:hypothetical protein
MIFFENWKQQKRISLDSYMSSDVFKDEFEDIIKKYQEMGTIESLLSMLDAWTSKPLG